MANEAKIQISFIRDDPGLVVRADTAEEIDQLIASALPIYKKFRDAVEKAQAKRAEAIQPTQPSPPFPAQGMPTATCETCGARMEFRKGISKKDGKPWQGLFCPNADKNNKSIHKPVWL